MVVDTRSAAETELSSLQRTTSAAKTFRDRMSARGQLDPSAAMDSAELHLLQNGMLPAVKAGSRPSGTVAAAAAAAANPGGGWGPLAEARRASVGAG